MDTITPKGESQGIPAPKVYDPVSALSSKSRLYGRKVHSLLTSESNPKAAQKA